MKYHFVKAQAWAPPGLGWIPGQTHLLMNSLTPAMPILPPCLWSSTKASAWASRGRTQATARHLHLLLPSPSSPSQPRTNGGESASSYQRQDSPPKRGQRWTGFAGCLLWRVTCCSNKCRSDGLPRTYSDVDPCISQKTDFNSTRRKAPLKSSILQHLCQLSVDFSYLLDCFHWWEHLPQLRSSLPELLEVGGTSGSPGLAARPSATCSYSQMRLLLRKV